ncbi:MAG: glycosyltransferase [Planctomycetota bacterium]
MASPAPRRIAHLVHLFPPESHGGTQSYVRALAKAQAAAGDQVRVICGSNDLGRGRILASERMGEVTVHRFYREPEERFSGDLGCERLSDEITAFVEGFGADMVHLHHWSGLSSNLVRRLAAAGLPVVVTLHDLFVTCARHFRMPDHHNFCQRDVGIEDCAQCLAPDLVGFDGPRILSALSKRRDDFAAELRTARRVLTVSDAQRDLLLSIPGLEGQDLKTFPIGVPGSFAPPSTRSQGPLEPGRLVVANWGGLDPRKGLGDLLQAIHHTGQANAYRVEVWGGGLDTDYGRDVQKLAAGIEVHFHGRYEDAELLSFGSKADVAVFPFLAFETYGLVVDEALRLDLPVLVSAHGAPPERLGESGDCFPAGNIEALAIRLELLRNQPENLLAHRQGKHGARSFADHRRALQALYDEVLS